MEKKHGELKIMTAKEMVDEIVNNYKEFECDFASVDIEAEDYKNIPLKYLNLEEVYKEAEGWCGIRVIKSPFDGDDVIVAVGDYGYGTIDAFNVRDDDDYEFPEDRLCDAIAECEYINGEDLEDVLVIVEMHDAMYILAEEERKRQNKMYA